MSRFRQAQRAESYLKLAIEGVSGAGKTYSSIKLMEGLVGSGRFVLVDTENGSGELYSHLTGYDYFRLEPPFKPSDCVNLIRDAVNEGYAGLIIDSYSHFWKYILEFKEKLDQDPRSNRFTNWGKVKPMYDELKSAILHSPLHIVCNLRSKAEYVQTESADGRKKIEKLGTNPITEPENEYEFTTVFTVERTHQATASKDRTGIFSDRSAFTINEHTGKEFLDWLHAATGGSHTVSAEWSEVATESGLARESHAEAERLGVGREPKALNGKAAVSEDEKAAGLWLKEIGMDKGAFADFKSFCQGMEMDWIAVALKCKEAGCKDVKALYAYLEDGAIEAEVVA